MKDKSMKKTGIVLISICMIFMAMNRGLAQSIDSQAITNWGRSVQGVQMAIVTTNDMFQAGSSAVIESLIKNSSTNIITVLDTIRGEYSDAVLVSDTGKCYHVTTRTLTFGYRFGRRAVQIGGQKVEPIALTFGKDIEAGDYKLKAMRKFNMGGKKFTFVTDGKEFTLESNSIKVKVVK